MKAKGFVVVDPKVKKNPYLSTGWGSFTNRLRYEEKGAKVVLKSKGSATGRLREAIRHYERSIKDNEYYEALPKKEIDERIKECRARIKKLTRCKIEEIEFDFPDPPGKRPLIDFEGSKKFEMVRATTSRRRCGKCGGTIFEGSHHLLAEAKGSYTISICMFCILSLQPIANHVVNNIPEELREEFKRRHGGFARDLANLI